LHRCFLTERPRPCPFKESRSVRFTHYADTGGKDAAITGPLEACRHVAAAILAAGERSILLRVSTFWGREYSQPGNKESGREEY
jgi:hypothetical protein